MFTTDFGKHAYDGNTITCEVDGFVVTATIHDDEDSGAPWENSDMRGVVTGWTSREADEDERVLCGNRHHRRYYDVAASLKAARTTWGFKTDLGAQAAVEADFADLRAWCADEWRYVGVVVTVVRDGVRLTGHYDHATWGIESIAGDYLRDVANNLLPEALADAKAKIAKWCEEVKP